MRKENNEMISIIVPIYNSQQYLRQCLESIIRQTYKNLQIICIDDGSTDNSMFILENYLKKDKRIKIIHGLNKGVSSARNAGLQIAQGEYILFVDSDDWIETSSCEIAINKINEEEADIVMWPYIREIKTESKKKVIFDKDLTFNDYEIKRNLHRRMIGIIDKELAEPENADSLCTVWGKLYRRSIISENGISFYDIRRIGTYEDGLFNLLYLQYAHKAVFLNRYLYHYRRTNVNSIVESYNPNLERQWDELHFIMKNYIQKNDLDFEYKVALQNRISLSLIPLGINVMTEKNSSLKKIKKIKHLITKKEYIFCIKELKIQYMPLHWQIFFKAALHKNALIVYALLYAIQKIRRR